MKKITEITSVRKEGAAAILKLADGSYIALCREYSEHALHGGAERPVATRTNSLADAYRILSDGHTKAHADCGQIQFPTLTDDKTLYFPADAYFFDVPGAYVDIDALLAALA